MRIVLLERIVIFFLCSLLKGMTIVCAYASSSVDPIYSQYFANAIYLNPAFAGSHICPRVKLMYRDHWAGIPRSYVNSYISYDQFLFAIESGVALNFSNERIGNGMLSNYTFGATYSKHIKLSQHWFAAAGLQVEYGLFQMDWNQLQFADQLDFDMGFVLSTDVPPPDNTKKSIWDFHTGITFDYKDYLFFGAAVHHLTQPQNGFYQTDEAQLLRKYTVYLTTEYVLQQGSQYALEKMKRASLSPGFMFQNQGSFSHILGGVNFNYYPFMVGGWFRHAISNIDALIVLVGFQQENYKIRYSFDITVSQLTLPHSSGAHELSFTWQFGCPKPWQKRIKAVRCPAILR